MAKKKDVQPKRVSNFALSSEVVSALKVKSVELSAKHGKHISMTRIVESLIKRYIMGDRK